MQRGAVLVVALVFLLVSTVLGVTAMSSTNLQERMAGNLRDSNLAFQAAESALRDGETFLQQATLPAFAGAGGLLPRQNDSGRIEFWNAHDWAGNSRAGTVIAGVADVPRYVIEELPPVPIAGGSVRFGALPDVRFYRVTARGIGGTNDAVNLLQSNYQR
jgi:type IV pilus assembly protein PilX